MEAWALKERPKRSKSIDDQAAGRLRQLKESQLNMASYQQAGRGRGRAIKQNVNNAQSMGAAPNRDACKQRDADLPSQERWTARNRVATLRRSNIGLPAPRETLREAL